VRRELLIQVVEVVGGDAVVQPGAEALGRLGRVLGQVGGDLFDR
jgi:hypothetical protein